MKKLCSVNKVEMYYIIFISLFVSVMCRDIDQRIYKEGDPCVDIDNFGNCTSLQECKQAQLDMKNNKKIKQCGTQKSPYLVCCLAYTYETLSRIQNLDDCKYQYEKRCEKTQRKSHDACVKYRDIVCPIPKDIKPSPLETSTENKPIVSDGKDSEDGQFPYLALLGFGNDSSTAAWQCGGSIISEAYILTAGHCTRSPDLGPVRYAVVGKLRRSDAIKKGSLHEVKRIIKHPDYKPPHKYHDIALLELVTPITFDQLVQPACLYAESEQPEEVAIVAGWGVTSYQGEIANTLQYADVYKFPDEECSTLYSPSRLLKQGFNSTTQLCYGHEARPKDTCQGDSGGPLETTNFHFPCLHTVIGVTSFGKQCGHTRVPAIYTRVEHYLPWIESIVWP